MLKFEVENLNQVYAYLDSVAQALDPVEVLDEAVAILLSRIRKRYLAEQMPDGKTKWKPSLAAQIRAAKGRGGGTLYDTGKLFNSIQEYADTETSRLIGTDVPYAKYHQTGLGDMYRPFMGANTEDEKLMAQLIIRRIQKVVK